VLQLDPVGIAIIVIQIAGFLLLLWVFTLQSKEKKEPTWLNTGFFRVAVAVNLVTVFAAMIPVSSKIVFNTFGSGFALFPAIWLHAAEGAVTIGSSIIVACFVDYPAPE
jgi:hypothetical protein